MKDRLEALDALRGFALVGIILGNVTWFSGYAVASPAQRVALGTAAIDEPVAWLLHLLVDGKFYGLFALMFGAGFALLVRGVGARGGSVAPVVRRRLMALFAIGLVHATVLWFGDIVSLYAIAAIPLYFMRDSSVRRLAATAIACLVAPVGFSVVVFGAAVIAGTTAHDGSGHGPAALLPAFAGGSYLEVLHANWAFLGGRWELALLSLRPIRLLGMFVLGMGAVRVARRPRHQAVRMLVVVALVTNLALTLCVDVPAGPPSLLGLLRDLIYAVAIPAGSLAYAAILWPAFSKRGPITRALAAAGRLSLSHYLTQSLVLAAIFYGYGLGLWGRVGLAAAASMALAIAAAQVLCSGPWLQRLGAGPAERALRWLTHHHRTTYDRTHDRRS